MNPKRTFPAALRRSPNPLRSVLPILLALLAFSSAQAQTVYRWIADNVDFGEPESPWTNLASWDPATMVPGTQPLNANDVVELNGDGSNGFGTATKEITINAATGSLTVGTLRFGDRDTGSALIIEDSDGNPATAQAEGIIFDTSVTSDGASDGVVSALFHGLDNLEAQDTRGILSVGSDAVYGNSGDAFEVGVSLRDADGFLFDGFFNFRIDSPMVDLLAGSGGSDFTKRGQGILFFDENDDTQATNGSLTGVNNVFVEEGELRFDGDNTDPDGVVTMQIQGDLVVGAGEALLNSRAASNARYVLPVLRLYRNNTGATISSTYTGTSATSEVGGSIYLNSGSLYIANSSIGAGGGEATIEPDIIVSGAGNQLQLNRANNNSEAVVFTGVITGSGELHKDDNARGVFTADNTFSGVLGVGQQSDDNGGNLGGVELVGANGAFSAVSEVRLYNNGTLVLENSDTLMDVDGATMAAIVGAVNNDRLND
ncbi:MAG: hypothetical protein KDK99_19245 [Verrucomicrobiales bacterium]|nr:hypothetical protein [Verrucomicrobiales bacterium]